MIYQIIVTILLIYTILIVVLGMYVVSILESDTEVRGSWYYDLGCTKEEATRRASVAVNTHFVLMLACAAVLMWGEYNVF